MMACITEPKTPSSKPKPHEITQMVIASGAQTRMPAIKYFFMFCLTRYFSGLETALVNTKGNDQNSCQKPTSKE